MFRLSMAALTALALSAGMPDCTPARLEHPLAAKEASKPDPKLEGTWAGRANEVEFLVHIGAREGGTLDVVLTGREPNKGIGVLSYEGLSSAVGGKTYLSLRQKRYTNMMDDKYELEPGYTLVRYELKGDQLSTAFLLDGAAQKGGLHPAPEGEQPRLLTDDSAALSAFVQKAGPEAWSGFGVYKRQKLDVPKEVKKK